MDVWKVSLFQYNKAQIDRTISLIRSNFIIVESEILLHVDNGILVLLVVAGVVRAQQTHRLRVVGVLLGVVRMHHLFLVITAAGDPPEEPDHQVIEQELKDNQYRQPQEKGQQQLSFHDPVVSMQVPCHWGQRYQILVGGQHPASKNTGDHNGQRQQDESKMVEAFAESLDSG